MPPARAIVADIGGTNARFAVVDLETLETSDVRLFPCSAHPTLAAAIGAYLAELSEPPSHTMNAMGHDVVNLIGAPQRTLAKAVRSIAPGVMAMGTGGMGMMGEMEMSLPPNTLPMMTGTGPFGPIEMGGMFTVMKVREGLARDDYRDPGWYQHPPGTVAHEVNVAQAGGAPRQPGAGKDMPGMRPGGHRGHD